MHDIFEEYLNNESQPTRQRALTSSSYKKVFQKEKRKPLPDDETNAELATYGDAILKHALCNVLFAEGIENITEEKKKYESDKVLVEIIARRYKLQDYIRFDTSDVCIPKDYVYRDPQKKGKNSPSKYIATAVEALIAAIYLDNDKDFSVVVEIAKYWKMLIDNS